MSELCGIQQWLVNIQMCILQQNLQKIVRQRCSKKLQNTYRFRDEDNKKLFIHATRWVVARNPMKLQCQRRKHSATICQWKISWMVTTNMENTYYDLRLQSNILLLTDVFSSLYTRNIKIFDLESAYFLSTTGLARQICSKNTKVEVVLLMVADMLLTTPR